MAKILVTGSAGFIGFHLTKRLLEEGWEVVGLDCINDYYDPTIKYDRLRLTGIEAEGKPFREWISSSVYPKYKFIRMQLEEREAIQDLFRSEGVEMVCHLAAQAGVRYSIENPYAYIDSNLTGFLNILEGCRHHGVKHLVYASSSSVYGLNSNLPLSEHRGVDHPVSMYAATKRSNELMAHTYSYLYGIPTTGLRFFTVYGPWGRPDMALFIFTRNILQGKPVQVFNRGEMLRDFTFVDDIIEGVFRVLDKGEQAEVQWESSIPDPAASTAPYRIYNIGNASPVKLPDFIDAIENKLGIKAVREYFPMQPGDVPMTFSDVTSLRDDFGYMPGTPVEKGISAFIDWYKNYHQVDHQKN